MSKASKRASGSGKSSRSRDTRHALAKQSAHKRVKSQSVKHIPKGRLEEATAELDSQLAHVQALYAQPEANAAQNAVSANTSNIYVDGLGDILRGL